MITKCVDLPGKMKKSREKTYLEKKIAPLLQFWKKKNTSRKEKFSIFVDIFEHFRYFWTFADTLDICGHLWTSADICGHF